MRDIGEYFEELFDQAKLLKDQARQEGKRILALGAADAFGLAAGEARKWLKSNEFTNRDLAKKLYVASLIPYFLYEEHLNRSSYYYAENEIDKAKQYLESSKQHLDRAIASISDAVANASLLPEKLRMLDNRLQVWKYYRESTGIYELALQAKEAWKREDVYSSLDYYVRVVELSTAHLQKVHELVNAKILEPIFLRIETGNYLGMRLNATVSMSKIVHSKLTSNDYPSAEHKLLGMKMLSFFLTSYRQAGEAFLTNPEAEQYHRGQALIEGNIEKFLRDNKSLWTDVYIEFQGDEELKKFMTRIDARKFRSVQNQISGDNKLVKLWSFGSFFLLTFLIISGAVLVFITHVNWWASIISFSTIEVLLLIVGAFVLRTIDDLSETGFLELVRMAFEFQFNVFSLINKIRRRQADTEGKPPINS